MLLWDFVRSCLYLLFLLLNFYSITVSSFRTVLLRWHQNYNRCSNSDHTIISTKASFNLYMNQQNKNYNHPQYIYEPIEVLTSNICDIPAKKFPNTIVLKNKYIGLRHGQSLANVEGRFHHH